MEYKIFQKKVVGKKGKIVKRWYCWYIDGGVQKQLVCKNCSTKAEAMAFVSSLPSLKANPTTVAQIAIFCCIFLYFFVRY